MYTALYFARSALRSPARSMANSLVSGGATPLALRLCKEARSLFQRGIS